MAEHYPIIDLVVDLGEGFGEYRAADDEALLQVVTSANVACGFHAGDPSIMAETVGRCVELGVAIGAHPGYHDLRGFGRRAFEADESELRSDVIYQLGALDAFVRSSGGRLQHVLPHGRMGNDAVVNETVARAVVDAVAGTSPGAIIVSQEGVLLERSRRRGLTAALAAPVDRTYENDGTLTPRRMAGAVIRDTSKIVDQALQVAVGGTVTSRIGAVVPLPAHSILLHGDEPGSTGVAVAVREALLAEGVALASMADVLAVRKAAAGA